MERRQHAIQAAVDRSQCIGNGPCFVLAPRAFQLDDAMKAVVLDAASEDPENLFAAARDCPRQAIYLSLHDRSLYPERSSR